MTYQQDLARLHRERKARLWPTAEMLKASAKQTFWTLQGTGTGRLMFQPSEEKPVPPIPMASIIDAVSEVHGIRRSEIVGRARATPIKAARFHAVYLCRMLDPNRSLPQIGRSFNRDHTTILNAVRRWEGMMDRYRAQILAVEAILFKDLEPVIG